MSWELWDAVFKLALLAWMVAANWHLRRIYERLHGWRPWDGRGD